MHSWEEELQAFRRRTKKSAQAWEAAKKRIPLGVNSNSRLVDPSPLYVRKAKGSRIWDADGAEYIAFCMAFGALVAGHSHPVLAKAMRERVSNGTIFGFESVDAGPLADHICRRFRLDRLKFSMTGLDATLFAVRLARAVTGRRRILKFEGCYHGSHDALMVSIKPKREFGADRGDRIRCRRRRASCRNSCRPRSSHRSTTSRRWSPWRPNTRTTSRGSSSSRCR